MIEFKRPDYYIKIGVTKDCNGIERVVHLDLREMVDTHVIKDRKDLLYYVRKNMIKAMIKTISDMTPIRDCWDQVREQLHGELDQVIPPKEKTV